MKLVEELVVHAEGLRADLAESGVELTISRGKGLGESASAVVLLGGEGWDGQLVLWENGSAHLTALSFPQVILIDARVDDVVATDIRGLMDRVLNTRPACGVDRT